MLSFCVNLLRVCGEHVFYTLSDFCDLSFYILVYLNLGILRGQQFRAKCGLGEPVL